MSKPVNSPELQWQDAADAGAPVADRRENERQIATFRTCCVMLDDVARPAILRNMSDGGAMFEALFPLSPDTRITYWWDGIDPVAARVAWVKDNRIGVANLSGPACPVDVPRPRATRVPARLQVRLWTGSAGRWAQMHDISLSGIAIQGLEGMAPGTLCTIELGGQALHNASIVRIEGGLAGIRFERPLPPARLMNLLDDVGRAPPRVADQTTGRTPDRMPSPPPHEPQADRAEAAPADAPIPLRRFL